MKIGVLLGAGTAEPGQPSAARVLAEQLGATAVIAVGVGSGEGPLREAAARLGLAQLAAAVDPALAKLGPRQTGQVLAALLRQEQVSLLLIDPEADRGEGMLAAAVAHHLHAAVLLGAERVTLADRPAALEVALPLAGRRLHLQLALPAVIVLAPGTAPAADAPAMAAADVRCSTHGLAALSLRREELIEPAPPITPRPGQSRPTPVKELSRLLAV